MKWQLHEKKSTSTGKYYKYYKRMGVIVSGKQKYILLTELAYRSLGDPEAVVILKSGRLIGFRAAKLSDVNSYKVADRSTDAGAVRRVNCITVLNEYGLLDGFSHFFPAYLEGDVLVFDTAGTTEVIK